MVLVDTLGRGLQFIISSEYVPLPSVLGERFYRAKVLDKVRGVDDSPQTRRVALDARPDRCELIFLGAPAAGCEETFVSWLNYHGFVSFKRRLKQKDLTHSEGSGK